MILHRTVPFVAVVGMAAWLTGCSSGTQQSITQSTQPISIQFFNSPPVSVSTGSGTALSAAVANSPSNLFVVWSVTCGTANGCGSFNPTSTNNTAATTYTAPTASPAGGSVIVTATSIADPTKSVSAPIAITSTSPPPVSVSFYAAPPASIQSGAIASISAQVVNDPAANPLVNWSATCSLAQCGTFSLNPSGSRISTFYTAPASPAASTIVSIRATSVTDPSRFVAAPVSIQLPIAITLYQFPPVSMPTATSTPISAHITNDFSANPQVTWSVTCNSAACGSFSTIMTGDEVSTTYTAPSTVPASGAVTVTATSVSDPSKSISAVIPILARVANPSLPDGNYVYQMKGGGGSTVGVFTAAGGYIVGGEQDSLGSQDPNTQLYGTTLDRISGGSYATDANGLLQINLRFANDGSSSFEATPAPHGKGFVLGATTFGGQLSGTLSLQTSTAPPAGGYAITLQGDNGAGASWAGGIIKIDAPGGTTTPGTFSGSGSELDFRSPYSTSLEELTISPGTVSVPDQYGRVVINLVAYAPNTTANVSAYLAGYSTDGVHLPLLETSNYYQVNNNNYPYIGDTADLSGVAIAQGTATGKFTANSVAGFSYVFGGSGSVFPVNTSPGYSTLTAGILTVQSNGNLSGTLSWNSSLGQSTPTPQTFTGTYTVDSEGRVNISNLSTTLFGDNLFLYVASNGQGLVMSNSPLSVFQGEVFQQQATPFSSASLSATYNLSSGSAPFLASSEDFIGSISAASNNGINILTGSGENPKLTGNQVAYSGFSLSGSFTPASNGIFQATITGAKLSSPATPDNFIFYLVDDTQGFAIETDAAIPLLLQLKVP